MPMGCSAHSPPSIQRGDPAPGLPRQIAACEERPGGESPHGWAGGFHRSSQRGCNATVDEMAVRWFRQAGSVGALLGEGAQFERRRR